MAEENTVQTAQPDGRIVLLDLWRGLALLFMIGHHICYDFVYFGFREYAFLHTLPVKMLHYLSAYPFIFLAGTSSCFSRNNLRRGLKVLICALLVSIVTEWIGNSIRFGILHFLGLSMVLYSLFSTSLNRIPNWIAPVLWLALFVVTKLWTEDIIVESRWLWIFGFPYVGFYSSDYFPMLPWVFLFLLGSWFGGVLQANREHPLLQLSCPQWLLWPGQHTLVIYLVHQPLLYGIFWLISR